MRTDHTMNPWRLATPAFQLGGRCIVRREQAPLGQLLDYRRAAGAHPHTEPVAALAVRRHGWTVNLGERGFGDILLGLGLVQALTDATRPAELRYVGPRPQLIRRCSLPVAAQHSPGPHLIHTGDRNPVRFDAIPEQPPVWLDLLDTKLVEVHAALPMRYYLAAEQTLGVRLPANRAPAPTFASSESARPFHIVFVGCTSWPDRKDYGADGFARIAKAIAQRRADAWQFTLIIGGGITREMLAAETDIAVLSGLDAVDCVDVFASAELVIGNDSGLTHLAALTERRDGTGPHVVGIHGRHAYTKWTTGRDRHHAVATRFSQMLSAADRCPVRDHLAEHLWSSSASLATLQAEKIADFAGRLVGWW